MNTQKGIGRGTLVVGSGLIAVGILFLIASVLGRSIIGVWWPLFVVVVGLLFFLPLALQGSGWGAFAIPGSIVTMTGLVLLFQNVFNAWASWAYVWALIAPFGVGVGLYIFGRYAGVSGLKDAGSVVMKIGLILFLVFGFFFEALLNISGSLATRIVWPVLLILVGLWIIVRPAVVRREGAESSAGSPTPVPAPGQWAPAPAVVDATATEVGAQPVTTSDLSTPASEVVPPLPETTSEGRAPDSDERGEAVVESTAGVVAEGEADARELTEAAEIAELTEAAESSAISAAATGSEGPVAEAIESVASTVAAESLERVCAQCGAALGSDAVFCSHCGMRLGDSDGAEPMGADG